VNPGERMSKNMERRKKTRATKNPATIYANSEGVVRVEKNGFFLKKMDNHIHMVIGRFLYDMGAPFDVVNSVCFHEMVNAILLWRK